MERSKLRWACAYSNPSTRQTVYQAAMGYAADSNMTTASDTVSGNWSYSYDQFNRVPGAPCLVFETWVKCCMQCFAGAHCSPRGGLGGFYLHNFPC